MIEMNQLTLTDYQDIKQRIRSNNNKIAECFVENGYYLKVVKENKMYLEDGYADIWDFAAGEFGYSRSTASRAMDANDKFSIDGNSIYLQSQYIGISKSVLEEMINLPVEDHELIKPNTKVETVRELKAAEREQREEEQSQIPGQVSLLSIMPDVVPESERPKKEEITITDVLRGLFKPREMKERLDSLVNMDPDSSEMCWWVGDFNYSGNETYKKVPFFIYFYSLEEGIKIKNVKTGEIKSHTYKDFYFMVRAAFHQETVQGTDVWNQAFGEEYEEELREKQKAEEEAELEKAMIETEKKLIAQQREERQRAIKQNQEKMAKSDTEKTKKEIMEQSEEENAAALNKIKENSDSDNEIEGNRTEAPEIVTGEVEEKAENTVCDIAQNKHRLISTQAIIERLRELNIFKDVYKMSIEINYDTYCNILEQGRRYLFSDAGYCVGDKLKLVCGDNPPITVLVLNYSSVPKKNAGYVAGFEVISVG